MITEFLLVSDKVNDLELAIQLINKKATHFESGVDIDGVPFLILKTGSGKDLPCPITDSKAMASLLQSWLLSADYSKSGYCNGDGDNYKGYILSIGKEIKTSLDDAFRSSYSDVLAIQPEWIYYGK